ncbi:hypothetical protein KEM54_005919 [Ascosphaera aggregata]|nr:hypothetical protein KEM54_005919 [Ascosphaera aggregata]
MTSNSNPAGKKTFTESSALQATGMTKSLNGVALTQTQQSSTEFATAALEHDSSNFNNHTGEQVLALPFQRSPTWYEATHD